MPWVAAAAVGAEDLAEAPAVGAAVAAEVSEDSVAA
jgi:hypothetical protein